MLGEEVVRQTDRSAGRDTLIDELGSVGDEPVGDRGRAAVLLRTDRRGCGQLIELSTSRVRLGRSFEVESRLDDESVSRVHAEISTDRGHHFVTDLGSANGTFVDGRRVESAALRDGAVLRLGARVTLRFSIVDEAERQALGCLQELGHYDPLTRVYNRRYLGQHLATELAFAERHQTSISVILFDLDHFKQINDEHGHPAGDAVLQRVAAIASQQIRTEDVIARYGGEEFVVVLRQTPVEGARALAERVRRAVAEHAFPELAGRTGPVTLSAGCASLSCPGVGGAAELIRLADRRLYRAKDQGRNRVVASEARLRSVPPPAEAEAAQPRAEEHDGPPSRILRVDRTARAFEALNEELQMVVGLHFQERCSFPEIAAILGQSEPWVEARFADAMEKLHAA